MSEPLWLYKWIDPSGKIHITADYHEANEALHSPHHPLVLGSRIRTPQESDPVDTYTQTP